MFNVTHCSESEARHVIQPAARAGSTRVIAAGGRVSAHQPIDHVNDFRYTSIELAIMIAKCVTRVPLEIYTPEIAIRNKEMIDAAGARNPDTFPS